MNISDDTIWVFDTSSLINVKELIKPQRREYVFDRLTTICEQNRLVYPHEVVKELSNGTKDGKPDLPLSWAKLNKLKGCRFGACYTELTIVMNHPVAQLTPDPQQIAGEDDADPHVLATALSCNSSGYRPTVVTQESRKVPPQVPLNVAAGALGLPCVHLYAMLIKANIWSTDLSMP